jgi:hypothetical protein
MTAMGEPGGHAVLRPRRRGLAALAAVAVLTALGYVSVAALRPPAALPAGAPADRFSAARAAQHDRTIAARTHVVGSAANDRVREYLLATLRGLRLAPAVQDTVSIQSGKLSASAGGIGIAHVRNVVARLPGTAPTGRIFLVAHYDSVQLFLPALGLRLAAIGGAVAVLLGLAVLPVKAGGPWGFVFHAPPPAGVEVALTVRGTGPVKLGAMDASDGLAGVPGFRPRPPGVGILGSHTSEMLAVARSYTF